MFKRNVEGQKGGVEGLGTDEGQRALKQGARVVGKRSEGR